MKKKVVFLPYDFDTALGTNNEGSLVFSYNLEDTDQTESGADVFNGQQSVFWKNLRMMFPAELKAMYQKLRSDGALSYQKVEEAFENHQRKWGEAIFNDDSQFCYLDPLIDEGNASYLAMLQGSKEEQRKWWLYNRFRYMDAKYNAGDALSDVIQLRGYAKANVTVKPYADIYAAVKFGSYLVQTRAARNTTYEMVCPLDNVNDTEIYIYSASQLASVGDLSGLKVGFADFSKATKIQQIKLGDSDENYNNGNLLTLYLGNNKLLRTLDVRNCSALGTGEMKAPDISGCSNIENVYFDGTAITGLTLPNGGILKVLHVPATLTNLTIRNQKAITDFSIPSYANISTLWLENVASTVDSKAILNAIPATSRVRLIGFWWEAATANDIIAIFDKLDTMRGLDEYGNNMDTAQCSGTIHISSLSGEESAAIGERVAAYPFITVKADHTSSVLTYMNYDGSSTLKTVSCIDGVPQEGAPSNPSRTATAQYTYTFVGWNTSKDAETAESGCTTNVTVNRTVYAAYSRTTRTYTVTWKNSNGTVLETDNNVPYGTTPTYNGSTPQNPTSGGGAFRGWTPTISAVTGDVTYTASYIPTYTATFVLAAADGGTTLKTQTNVPQGTTPTPPSETPVSSRGSDYTFKGWTPALAGIQANTTYTAVFEEPQVWFDEEITDDWATIVSKINAGTADYKPGNYKPLDLGAQGIINMQIVAKNVDPLADGTGNAPYTWIGKELLKSKHRMNPSRSGSSGNYTEGTGAIGGWSKSEMRTYMRGTIKPLIPEVVRNAIKEVTKYSGTYNTAGTLVKDDATTDDVWLPSYKEMFNYTSSETKGTHYSMAFPDNASRVKSVVGGSAAWWWLGSAYGDISNSFYHVGTDGGASGASAVSEGGVPLGFCL